VPRTCTSRIQPGEKSARTVPSPDGLLIVEYAASGRALGVEITAPQAVPLDRLNPLLRGAWRAAPRGAGLQAGSGRINGRSIRSTTWGCT